MQTKIKFYQLHTLHTYTNTVFSTTNCAYIQEYTSWIHTRTHIMDTYKNTHHGYIQEHTSWIHTRIHIMDTYRNTKRFLNEIIDKET